ncbi:MAG: acyltransferase family protein [Clostridiales bacterium]|nr:acyltransferase family protein [Clostridiales bacterium]
MERDYHLDMLKILSCISVVGLHTLQKDISLFNSSLYYLCGFAVPVFFMSSGSVLMNRGQVGWRYVGRKVVKIFKIVVAWNLIAIFVKIFAKLCFDLDYELSCFILLEEVVNSFLQRGNLSHFWYFGSLVILYLFLPLLSKISDNQKKFLIITLAVFASILQLISSVLGRPIQGYVIQTFRVWTWLFYFIFGGCLYSQIKAIKLNNKNIYNSLLAIMTLFTILFQNIFGRYIVTEISGTLHAEFFYDSIITKLWVSTIFLFVNSYNIDKHTKSIITLLSPLILGVYIIHPLIIKCVQRFYDFSNIFSSVCLFFIALFFSFLISYVLNKISLLRRFVEI